MENIAVQVNNLTLKYKFVKSMNIKQEIKNVFIGKRKQNRTKEVIALNDVSFNVKKGSVTGIIGTNGSGKSTLLKTIAKIFEPDNGEVNLHSDSVSLLALGSGFQPELSGRENIYINGLLLGMKKSFIDEKVDEIIEFSDLGEFINYPIRTYSAGMKTRLAFSIASHIEPEILLIDEVLGVGDQTFREKSSKKIKNLILEDRTVLLVSHSIPTVKQLCDKTIWLHKGVLKMHGETNEVIEEYMKFVKNNKK